MRRYWMVRSLFVATLFVLALDARAASAQTSVAVLGFDPQDVPEALAQQLAEALRQRAASTAGIRLAPAKDLIELKMVFGCDGEAPACMAQAGRSLGADKLLFGLLKKSGKNAVSVTLKTIDVRSATLERSITETVHKRELAAGSVAGNAARWLTTMIPVEVKPILNVLSDPPNAAVTVDGQPAGRTPLTLRELAPGAHTLTIAQNGRTPVTRSVELRPGGSHDVVVTLEPEAVAAAPPKEPTPQPELVPELVPAPSPSPAPRSHPGRPAKIAALGLLGGAVIAGAMAIYTWRTYVDLEDRAYQDLVGIRPASASPEEASFFSSPSCTTPSSLGSSPAVSKYQSDCSSGESYALATTALWISAGALATGSVIAFVVGNRQDAKAKERASSSTTALIRQSLRIQPVLSRRGGALQASFSF